MESFLLVWKQGSGGGVDSDYGSDLFSLLGISAEAWILLKTSIDMNNTDQFEGIFILFSLNLGGILGFVYTVK